MQVHKTKLKKNKTVLWGTITWFEMGKQSLQAKNVYYGAIQAKDSFRALHVVNSLNV